MKTGDSETIEALNKVSRQPIFFNDSKSDSQGYGIEYDGEDGRLVILAIRGTSSLSDALADADIRLARLKTNLVNTPKSVLVHSGFLGQYMALESQLDEYIRMVYHLDAVAEEPKIQEDSVIISEPASQPLLGFDHSLANKIDEMLRSGTEFALNNASAPVSEPVSEPASGTLAEKADDVKLTVADLSSDFISKAREELRYVTSGNPAQVIADAKDKIPEIQPAVDDLVTGVPDEVSADSADVPLLVVGHSLGSAVSAIAALVFNLKYGDGVNWIGFGCPRVGNQAWATLFNSVIDTAIRVKQGRDCQKPLNWGNHLSDTILKCLTFWHRYRYILRFRWKSRRAS